MLIYSDEAVEVEKVEAEEEQQLTLDEWKAMQERGRAKPTFNIRKPGEGCQTVPEWKKMYVLKKKVEDEDEDDEEYEEVDQVAVYLCGIIIAVRHKFFSYSGCLIHCYFLQTRGPPLGGTAAASAPPTGVGDCALCGSQPLVTPVSLCRFRD